MSEKTQEQILMKGNEAIAEAACRAGCLAYYGYPITPQNELIGYMAKRLPELGRVFIQAESEVSAINMVYGSASCGVRAMTSSSSPGISLKQEGISYAAGADIPLVFVNIVRGGPGLGSIAPAQSDYFQSTRGGGHGDYHVICLAPASVQEACDLTYAAFDMADTWRVPVMILGDGVIGQMMEGITLPPMRDLSSLPSKASWAVGNMKGRASRHITSINLVPAELEKLIRERFERYAAIAEKEVRYEEKNCQDAKVILVAYGTSARICQGALEKARAKGLPVGLFRPISVWPFPSSQLSSYATPEMTYLSVEMSMGQMVEDIRLAVNGKAPVELLAHSGGVLPTEEEIVSRIERILEGKA